MPLAALGHERQATISLSILRPCSHTLLVGYLAFAVWICMNIRGARPGQGPRLPREERAVLSLWCVVRGSRSREDAIIGKHRDELYNNVELGVMLSK